MKNFVLGLFALAALSTKAIEATNLVCYYNSQTAFLTGYGGNGNFMVSNIDLNLCTHYVYTTVFVNTTTNTVVSFNSSNYNSPNNGFLSFTALKSKNSMAKFLLALSIRNYPGLDLSTPFSIQSVVNSTVDLLTQYNFDGLCLDWNFPSSPANFTSYSNLVAALKTAFLPYRLLLTSSVSSRPATIDGYDVSVLNSNLDQVYVLAYNFNPPTAVPTTARHNSPLYTPSNDSGMTNLTTNNSINYWLAKGLSRKLIHLGMTLEASTWDLNASIPVTSYTPPLAAIRAGRTFYSYNSYGSLSFSDMLYVLNTTTLTAYQDPDNNTGPWAANQSFWVGYDDPAMARTKANYVLQNNLAGAALFDITQDDFNNLWGLGKNPFITSVSSVLKSYFPTTTSTTTTSTTSIPMPPGKCPSSSRTVLPDPTSCRKFFICLDGVPNPASCPQDKYFNSASLRCEDDPTNTKCPPLELKRAEVLSYNAVKYDWKVNY